VNSQKIKDKKSDKIDLEKQKLELLKSRESFFKELSQNNSSSKEPSSSEDLFNPPLLEEEEKFLKELGWNPEEEEGDYSLTEEEISKFKEIPREDILKKREQLKYKFEDFLKSCVEKNK